MSLEILLEHRNGVLTPTRGLQRDGVDVSVARLLRVNFRSATQFIERAIRLLEPHKNQPKRIMQGRITAGQGECFTKHPFSVAVPAQLAIKVRKVDRGGGKGRIEPERGAVLGLCVSCAALPSMEIGERRPCLGPVGIQLLRSDELGCGADE